MAGLRIRAAEEHIARGHFQWLVVEVHKHQRSAVHETKGGTRAPFLGPCEGAAAQAQFPPRSQCAAVQVQVRRRRGGLDVARQFLEGIRQGKPRLLSGAEAQVRIRGTPRQRHTAPVAAQAFPARPRKRGILAHAFRDVDAVRKPELFALVQVRTRRGGRA